MPEENLGRRLAARPRAGSRGHPRSGPEKFVGEPFEPKVVRSKKPKLQVPSIVPLPWQREEVKWVWVPGWQDQRFSHSSSVQ
jgi:hypothetical protein